MTTKDEIEELREIVNSGIHLREIGENKLYYDLEYCRKRLRELDSQREDWVWRNWLRFFGIFASVMLMAMVPLGSAWLYGIGPEWVRASHGGVLTVSTLIVLFGIIIGLIIPLFCSLEDPPKK